jgi:hypothetical protein
MREVSETDGPKLSFFMYEELNALRQAAQGVGLSAGEIEDVMYTNAAKLIRKAGGQIG